MAILVIRSDDSFSSTLREAGYDVVNLELIETSPLKDLSHLREKISRIGEYDGLFFTSPVAAKIFVSERKEKNGFHGNIYALGARARNVLESAGINVRFHPEANTAEEMLSKFGNEEFAGKRFLFVRGVKSLKTIPDLLGAQASIDEVVVYDTTPANIARERIEDIRTNISIGKIDRVCFFSPSAVERFAEVFGDIGGKIRIAVIGSTTAQAAKQARFDVDFISPRSGADDFARGLIEHIKNID